MNALKYIAKKYNANIRNQDVVEIHNMGGSKDLAELFAELHFNIGAEIGVDRGLYSEILCKANPKLHLYSIDSWSTSSYEEGSRKTKENQQKFERHYKSALRRLSLYNCEVLRMESLSAIKRFKDSSLDFVYIDANHSFVNFINDLHHWIKKVHPGGIVSGHDFQGYSYEEYNHVKSALLAYAKCYKMTPIFVLSTDRGHRNLRRDMRPSWLWVKQ